MDLSYARDGLPLLLDHNQRVQVGLVENIRLDKDRRLRGDPRPGNHPDAEWVAKDIRGGIRKKISVGYDPGSTYEVVSGRDDKVPTRRYRNWRPMEASTVAVPADYDVGVARSVREAHANLPPTQQPKGEGERMTDTQSAPAGGASAVTRDYDAERRARNAAIGNILALAHESKRAELSSQALREDWTVEVVADKVREANIAAATAGVSSAARLNEREQKNYSITRAIMSMATSGRVEAGFEREVSADIAKRMGRDPAGLYLPFNLGAHREMAAQVRAQTGNVAGTTSLGGAGVQTSVVELIELLRAAAVTVGLGARVMSGLQGNVQFPRQITANGFTWEGENPGTAKALTAATLDSFTMSPKTGMIASSYSKQFLQQSSFSVEQFVREDLAQTAGLGVDIAVINGSGSGNQPTGIMNLSGVETEVMGTHGAQLAWSNLVSYETKQAINNAAQGRLAFLTTPGVRGRLKNTLKNTVTGSEYLWGASNELNGYPAVASNQVPSNLTKGTSTTICHGVIFGNWLELLIGMWGEALDITVDPYTAAAEGMVRVIAQTMMDTNARHPKSFVVTKDALT